MNETVGEARQGAVIIVSGDGRYVDASPGALELLGVSLAELQALPPGALSTMAPDDASALRAAWEESGATTGTGQATVRRPDGTSLRVRFVLDRLPDAGYRAIIEPLDESADEPLRFYTVGAVLAAWRSAERRLTALAPETAEWHEVCAEIDRLRREYGRLFEAEARRDQPA